MAKKIDASRFNKDSKKKRMTISSPFAIKEAYSSIRTKLLYIGQGEKCPIYIISSPMPGDGKTINAINLAISYSQLGKKTLIIDGDMRNPTVHKYFDKQRGVGLSELLAGLTEQLNICETDVENLWMLSSGDIPPNPAELLSSRKFDDLLKAARNLFDCVFIDTPPIEMVTDATVVAGKVTGYILIIRMGSSDINVVKNSVSSLERIGAKIVGFILNDVNGKSEVYKSYYSKQDYKYDYKYSYSAAQEKGK